MKINILLWISITIVLCNLYLLSTSRLRALIKGLAVEGILISLLPALLPNPAEKIHIIILVALSGIVKGFVIPQYLFRAIRDVREVRITDPGIGYSVSLLCGIIVSALSFYALRKIPLYSIAISPIHASISISTAFIGLFLIIFRKNIVSQVVGYLVFENSGFVLALSVAAFQPLFIEIGILLDVVLGVVIMSMAVNYIHNVHETISTHTLERLKQ